VILNRTNAGILAQAFGDEADGWAGQLIELWQAPVEFRGRTVPGVKVAPVLQQQPAARPPQSQTQATRGNGNGSVQIPEQTLEDELEDSVPF
jgi:hypothetical protein